MLAVFDYAKPIREKDEDLINRASGKNSVAVINKVDLEKRLDTEKIEAAFAKTVYISAKNNEGLSELAKAVEELLGVENFDTGAPMLANMRQRQNCQNARENIASAIDSVNMGMTYDAINVMCDCAADELLSLTGEKATEQVVNNIFSKFCVGK